MKARKFDLAPVGRERQSDHVDAHTSVLDTWFRFNILVFRSTILCLNIEYIKNKVSGWRFTLKSLFFTPRNASFWLFFCRLLLDYFNKMKSRLHPFSLNQINYQQALVLNDIITNVIILTQCMYVYCKPSSEKHIQFQRLTGILPIYVNNYQFT